MFKPVTALLATWLLAGAAHASVVIGTTRIIYPAAAPEVTVQLFNRDEAPALLQVWLDDGDADADPQHIQVPFIISPAMFRIEPEKGQSLRLMYTQEALPADRESLFWLNVLQVPPKVEGAANSLQMAIRTRIKLMFRPDGLAGRAAAAPAQVRWTLQRSEGQWFVQAQNPSPFVVNLGEVNLTVAGRTLEAGAGHVLPFANSRFTVQGDPGEVAAASISYIALDDYGAGRPGQASVAGP